MRFRVPPDLYDNRGHGKTREPGDIAKLNFQTMALMSRLCWITCR